MGICPGLERDELPALSKQPVPQPGGLCQAQAVGPQEAQTADITRWATSSSALFLPDLGKPPSRCRQHKAERACQLQVLNQLKAETTGLASGCPPNLCDLHRAPASITCCLDVLKSC